MRYSEIIAESLSPFDAPKPRSKSPKGFTREDNLVITVEYGHIKAWNGTPHQGGMLIGYAGIGRQSDSQNWSIINVEIKPPYRNKKIGRAIYEACEAFANSKGGILVPATSVSDDAYRLWKSWKPERIAYDHRPFDQHYVGKHIRYNDRDWVITRAAQTFPKSLFSIKEIGSDTTAFAPKSVVFDQLGDFYTGAA